MTKNTRPFYKYWQLWVVLVIICGWPYVNDWQWDSAKDEAKAQIAQFEAKVETQAKAQPGVADPAHGISIEMSRLTCVAANTFYASYWSTSSPYRVKLIQAFVWHGYGVDVPAAKSVKERGCGQTEDGKYVFVGT